MSIGDISKYISQTISTCSEFSSRKAALETSRRLQRSELSSCLSSKCDCVPLKVMAIMMGLMMMGLMMLTLMMMTLMMMVLMMMALVMMT